MTRAVVSTPPPGGKPTTILTGFAGKSCACAGPPNIAGKETRARAENPKTADRGRADRLAIFTPLPGPTFERRFGLFKFARLQDMRIS
jgi:hypothetical protein